MFADLRTPTFRDRCDLLMRWLERSIRTPVRLARIEHACSVIGRSDDLSLDDFRNWLIRDAA